MIRNESSFRVEAVHRALVLLKLMAEEGSLSVTEAAKALDVNPSTAQRLLATLTGADFARQGEHRRYSPGPEFLRPGMMLSVPSLRIRARPYLERLFERVGETVHLATLVGTKVHHIDGIEAARHALRFGLRTGVILPAHLTSSGKAMLAELSPEDLDARYTFAAGGPGRREPEVDLAKLHQMLAKTRQQGVGVNYGESEDGVAAFAISLGVIEGEHAAFSIAMPLARYTPDDARGFAEHLVQTAQEFKDQAV